MKLIKIFQLFVNTDVSSIDRFIRNLKPVLIKRTIKMKKIARMYI